MQEKTGSLIGKKEKEKQQQQQQQQNKQNKTRKKGKTKENKTNKNKNKVWRAPSGAPASRGTSVSLVSEIECHSTGNDFPLKSTTANYEFAPL